MVYATIFPTSAEDYPLLRDAMEKLKLNDAALSYEPENIPSIGFGFAPAFLVYCIWTLFRSAFPEYDLDWYYRPKRGLQNYAYEWQRVSHTHPAEWPDPSIIAKILEPWMDVDILAPQQYIGPILEIVTQRRGTQKDIQYITAERVHMKFEML